jgi:hypothetical protein
MFEADIKDGTDCAEMLRTVVYANLTLTAYRSVFSFKRVSASLRLLTLTGFFLWGARRFALRWCPQSLIADEVFALSKVAARLLWPMSRFTGFMYSATIEVFEPRLAGQGCG